MKRIVFIIGTDTGVGKTFLSARLIRGLIKQGINVRAAKPFCSGGRDDAGAMVAALGGKLTIDEINPWHFPEPITPLLAARKERRAVSQEEALRFLRTTRDRCDCLVVEGAGGLLSPLGEGFASLELIRALRATPLLVAPNRLGVLNHVLLTLKALPETLGSRTTVVLMEQRKPDHAASGNRALLKERLGAERVFVMPFVTAGDQAAEQETTKSLTELMGRLGMTGSA